MTRTQLEVAAAALRDITGPGGSPKATLPREKRFADALLMLGGRESLTPCWNGAEYVVVHTAELVVDGVLFEAAYSVPADITERR